MPPRRKPKPLDLDPLTYGIVCTRLDDIPHTNMPYLIVFHSPAGYDWGYKGLAPAELALNILEWRVEGLAPGSPRLDLKLGRRRLRCYTQAWDWHRQFMDAFLWDMPEDGGTIPLVQLDTWLTAHPSEEPT